GDALILESLSDCAVDFFSLFETADVSSVVLVLSFSSAFALGALAFLFNKGVMSVPFGPTMAMISLTFAACPFSKPTYNNVPSAYAVTSIVALSVSTSAIASSLLISSPTLKFHSAITPSVIVSLNRGIVITVTPKSSAATSLSESELSSESDSLESEEVSDSSFLSDPVSSFLLSSNNAL